MIAFEPQRPSDCEGAADGALHVRSRCSSAAASLNEVWNACALSSVAYVDCWLQLLTCAPHMRGESCR